MSDKGKSDQLIEREERFRVALEDTRGHDYAARSEANQRTMEKKREIRHTYRATLANDEQLAARAGHSDQRRQRDSMNRYHAYNAAKDDDERMDFFFGNRAGDQYNQRVHEGTERRIRERNESEREEVKK